MKKKLMVLAPLAFAMLMFFGCSARITDESGDESGTESGQASTDVSGASDTEAPETTIIVVEANGTTATMVLTVTEPEQETTTPTSGGSQSQSVTTTSAASPQETPSESEENVTTPADEKVNISDISFPSYGTIFASLKIESIGVNLDVFFGDDNQSLKNGLGMYTGSSLPGKGGRTIIAGHNTEKMLRKLGDAKIGEKIVIKTTYGTYVYEITSTEITSNTDTSAIVTPAGEYLVLYTCYPFTSLWTQQRYFVQAKKISGPVIVG